MSMYLVWMALYAFFGHPLVALGLVLVIVWLIGRRTFFRSRPERYWARRRRETQLRHQLAQQDWNRPVRFELADWLRTRGRHAEAADILRPNLEQDDDDDTLFVMGVATYGAGQVDEGERLLGRVAARSPKFKDGDVFLELGRHRLQHGDTARAIEALERFVAMRQGTVEGRTLLAQAHARAGDEARARTLRDAAWTAFKQAPSFIRRRERYWAYRARPWRGVLWIAVAIAITAGIIALLTLALSGARRSGYGMSEAPPAQVCTVKQASPFIGHYAFDPSTFAANLGEPAIEPAMREGLRHTVALEVSDDRLILSDVAVCFTRILEASDTKLAVEVDWVDVDEEGEWTEPVPLRYTLSRDGDRYALDTGTGTTRAVVLRRLD